MGFGLILRSLDLNEMSDLVTRISIYMALLTGLVPKVDAAEKLDRGGLDFFESKIRPVLIDKCYRCHSADAKKLI